MSAPVKPGLYVVRLPCKKPVWVHVLPPADPEADDCPTSTMKVTCPVETSSSDDAPNAA